MRRSYTHHTEPRGDVVLTSFARTAVKLIRLLTFAAGRQGLRCEAAAAAEHSSAFAGLNVAPVVGVRGTQPILLTLYGVFPGATIYCFAPSKAPAERLREPLGAEVRLLETAIGLARTVEHMIHEAERPASWGRVVQ
jgi:hypothetical protein